MRPTCVTCATKAMYILRACRIGQRDVRVRGLPLATRAVRVSGLSFSGVVGTCDARADMDARMLKFLQTTITHATRPRLAPLRLARDDCRWPSVPRMQLRTFRDGRFRAAALFLLPPQFAYICACLANVLARSRPSPDRATDEEREAERRTVIVGRKTANHPRPRRHTRQPGPPRRPGHTLLSHRQNQTF